MSSSWSKNDNKNNNRNNNCQDEKKKKGKKSISSTLPSRPTILPHPLWVKRYQKSGCFTLESGGLGILTLASLCDKEEKQKYQP